MVYQIKAILMTLSHLKGHSLLQAFQMWFFVQLCNSCQHFDWHSASHGPSAVAELSVNFSVTKHKMLLSQFTFTYVKSSIAVHVTVMLVYKTMISTWRRRLLCSSSSSSWRWRHRIFTWLRHLENQLSAT